MNTALLFIPLAVCLQLCLVGLAGAVLAALLLRRERANHRRQSAQGPQPPVLRGPLQRPATSLGCWVLCLKGLLVASLLALGLGLLGVWGTKPSIGYAGDPPAHWSDGRAPQLEPLIRKHAFPFLTQAKSLGLAIALVTPTNATIMTFGRPCLSSRRPPGADTLFEIGSITKTFTGLTLARAIERGTVRLDQPIQELLPPGVKLPEAAREVTLRHLTTHSSGFPRLPEGWSRLRSAGMLLFGSDPYAGYTAADLLADVRTVKLASTPGTKGCYSNFGMALLGYLLATKAGCAYEALVKREVCSPLEMNDTTVTPSHTQARRVAQGYRVVLRCRPLVLALRSAPWFKGNDLGGAGALRSTAADMLKYLQANMHPEGQPLEQALRESHRVLFKEDERLSYGMNWIHAQSQRLGRHIICHDGGTGGFRSFLGFTADRRFGVLILSNSAEDVNDLAVALLRDLAPPTDTSKP